MQPYRESSKPYEARLDVTAPGHAPAGVVCLTLIALGLFATLRLGVAVVGAVVVAAALARYVPASRDSTRSSLRPPQVLVLTPDGAVPAGTGPRRPVRLLSAAFLPALGLIAVIDTVGGGRCRVVALKQQQPADDWRRATVLWRFRGPSLVARCASC